MTEARHITPRRAVAMVSGFWVGYLLILSAFGVLQGFLPSHLAPLAWGAASVVALLALTHRLLRREGRPAGQVGLGWTVGALPRFLIGFLLGVAVYVTLLFAIAAAVGPLSASRVTPPTSSALLISVVTTIALAMMEEVGFRAYPLWTLAESLGIWRSQAVVALVFALVHLLYGWSIGQVVFGVLPSGLLFGAVAVATRGIAGPLGVHVALNLCQQLTGEKNGPRLWDISMSNPSEPMAAILAPILGVVVVGGAAALVMVWSHSRSRAVPR